jgi:hypothetical protein
MSLGRVCDRRQHALLTDPPAVSYSLAMPVVGSRQPAILEWIDTLEPEAELVARMALREVPDHCGGDSLTWNRRIDELMAEIDPDDEQLARILNECVPTSDA